MSAIKKPFARHFRIALLIKLKTFVIEGTNGT